MKSFASLRSSLVSMFAVAMFAVAFAGTSAIAQVPGFFQVPYVSVAAGDINSSGSSVTTPSASCTTGLKTTGGGSYGDGCPANQAGLIAPWGTMVDAWGNVYFGNVTSTTTPDNSYVRVIYGGLTTVGSVANPATAMIEAANATQAGLVPVAGDVYALAGGLTATLGSASPYYCNGSSGTVALNSDGSGCPATQSYLKAVYGGVVDSDGNVFVVDKGNSNIYVILANATDLAAQLVTLENPTVTTPQVGYIYTIVGDGGGYTDGVLASPTGAVHAPYGLAIDQFENLYITDYTDNAVRMINGPGFSSPASAAGVSPSFPMYGPGYIHTIAGASCSAVATTSAGCTALATVPSSGVPAFGAAFDFPEGIAVDGSGNVYIGDNGDASPKTVPSTVRVIYAGGGASNPVTNLICLENSGIASCATSLVTGDVYTIAGGGNTAGSGNSAVGNGALGTSSTVVFDKIQGLAVDAQGNVYIGDYNSHGVIAELNVATGYLTYIAGDGQTTFGIGDVCGAAGGSVMTDSYGDGCPGPESTEDHLEGNIAVDGSGNIYFADDGNSLVRKLTYNSGLQSAGTFPSTAVATPAAAQNLAFTLLTGATAEAASNVGVSLLTVVGGSASTEFTDAGTAADTCTNSSTLTGASNASTTSSNTVCEVPIIFTPAAAGARTGSLQINATINSVTQTFGTVALTGVGTGGTSTATTTTAGLLDGTSITYGNTPLTFNITVSAASGKPTGNIIITLDGVAGTPVATNTSGVYIETLPNLNVGTHTFSASFVASGSYTASTTGDLHIIVSAEDISATAASNTYTAVYGQALPTITGTLGVGVVAGDNVSPVFTATGVTVGSGVATYPITVTLTGSSAGNYIVALNGSPTLTITKAPLTVTANAISVVQGQAVPTITGGTLSGVLPADASNVTVTFMTTATTTSTPGSYLISAVLGGSAAGNYTVSIPTPTYVTITAPGTVNVAVTSASSVYGAALPTLSGVLTGVAAGDASNVSANYSTIATSTSIPGTYPITATMLTGSAASNYTLGTVTNGTLTITKAPLTVTANAISVVQGQPIPTLTGGTLVGVVGSDVVTVTFTSTATTTSTPGTYLISAVLGGSAAGNYTVSIPTPTYVTITAPPTVTDVVTSASSVYGSALPTLTGVLSGVATADLANVFATYSTTATSTSVPGTYPITVTGLTGSAASKYTLGTVTAGTLTITKAPLTVSANAISVVQGQPIPTLTGGTLVGVVGSDVVTVTFTSTATTTSTPGTYLISAVLGGSAAGNYTVSIPTPTYVTITAAPTTVTDVVTSASSVYGSALPTLTGVLSGVATADLANVFATYSTTATSTSVPGTYPITVTGLTGSAASKYTLGTVTAGTLTITKAPLTVSANAISVVQGQTIPTLTGGALVGVVGSDVVTVTFTSTATSTSTPGTYLISAVLGGSAAGNYTVSIPTPTYVTITAPPTVTVAVNSFTIQYGAAIPTLTGVLTGEAAGDAANLSANYSTTGTSKSAPGTYPITATALIGSAAGNYKLGTVTNGILTITTATTSTALTASAASIDVGGNVTFTATVTSSGGTPTGSVTFYAGTTSIGTGTLSAGVATLSTISLPYGTQSITAVYTASTDYATSTSAAVSESVILPIVSPTISASSLNLSASGSGTVTLSLTALGGYTGVATYSCANLPAYMTCTFAPPTATFTSTATTATTVLTISTTSTTTALLRTPVRPGSTHSLPLLAFCFPGVVLGFLGVRSRKNRQGWQRLMMVVLLFGGLAGIVGLTGCGSSGGASSHSTPAGTYNITVQVTAGTVQTVPLTVTVQ